MKTIILSSLVITTLALSSAMTVTTQVGDYDPEGSSSSCVTLKSNLRYRTMDSTQGGDVFQLQDFLNAHGYLKNEPTGYFGVATLQAVKVFQGKQGFSPTGYVGPLTREAIAKISCSGELPSVTSYEDKKKPLTEAPKKQEPTHKSGYLKIMTSPGEVYVGKEASLQWKSENLEGRSCTLKTTKDGYVLAEEKVSSAGSKTISAKEDMVGKHVFTITCIGEKTYTESAYLYVQKAKDTSSWDKKVNILSPNGGETLYFGKETQVLWKTTDPGVGSVTISLRDEETGKEYQLASNVPNTGSYTIKTGATVVPGLPLHKAYRIHMWWYPKEFGGIDAVGDKSDGYFKVTE